MRKLVQFISIILIFKNAVQAQDAQMSQFYAAPLYYNPAFTGGGTATRVMANYRNQWPSLNANFVTSIFAVDHYVEKINSGFGIMVLDDKQGNRIKNTEVSAMYAYQLKLDETNFLRMGLQGTYSSRSFDANGLVWGDQIGSTGNTGASSSDPLANSNALKNINVFDVSSGFLFYNPTYFLGLSVHHITNPAISYINSASSVSQKIGRNYNLNGGFNINVGNISSLGSNLDRELILTPTFLYKLQNNFSNSKASFSQLDLGFYATYAPFTVGLFYRGVPLKKVFNKFPNQDAITSLIGYRMDNFSIGYSFDYTISKLGMNTGGSHELSIAYQFEKPDNQSSYQHKKRKMLSCPKF